MKNKKVENDKKKQKTRRQNIIRAMRINLEMTKIVAIPHLDNRWRCPVLNMPVSEIKGLFTLIKKDQIRYEVFHMFCMTISDRDFIQ